MSIDNRRILVLILIISIVTLPVVIFSEGIFRIILGLLLAIFFPGYTLLSSIFPKQNDLSGTERVALSFGLSLAIIPLTGLILNYTPWGIRVYPVTIFILIFIVVTASIGYYRQQRLPPEDRFRLTLQYDFSKWWGLHKLNRVLSICLIIAILSALGALGFAIAVPKQGERFTEFYILGTENIAADYPRRALYGESVEVIIGIVNHELEPASYKVRITLDGKEIGELNIDSLADEEKYEQKFSFIPTRIADKQNLEFQLYKDNNDEPYFEYPLYLYIDVVSFTVVNEQGQQIYQSQLFDRGEAVNFIVNIVNKEPEKHRYRIEIKADDSFKQEITTEPLSYLDKWQKKISFIPEPEEVKQTLEFRVYLDDEKQPFFDTPVYVPIQLNLPRAPALISPADGEMISGDYILFQWEATEDSVQYILQIYADSNWNEQLYHIELDNTTHTHKIPLISDDGTTYYWRVWAENEAGFCPESDVNANGRSFID